MSTASEPQVPSRFAATLLDLLDRVEVRRVSPDDQFDPVYRLRYEAYRRENFIPINSQRITRDQYDDAENCYCFGVYIDNKLVSSIRLHIASPDNPTSPSAAIWPSILGDIVGQGQIYVDPSRFTADHDATLAFPALPYLTLRTAVMASMHFGATYCISSVRSEHSAFYRRVFHSKQLAGEGFWGELTFPVCLYACHVPTMANTLFERFPFFDSTPEERQALFARGKDVRVSVTPSAKQARRLKQIAEAV
jgi:N-acyl-L-homoserine lactone synthetase